MLVNSLELPLILCVDDESLVLEALVLYLRTSYQVYCASGGEEALHLLTEIGGVSVVISDMRMQGMNGATLLQRVKSLYPDTTRILLSGDSGDAAAAAVNEAQIFRFLTKPCPPEQLKAAIEEGVTQHRLINAQRAVMQEII